MTFREFGNAFYRNLEVLFSTPLDASIGMTTLNVVGVLTVLFIAMVIVATLQADAARAREGRAFNARNARNARTREEEKRKFEEACEVLYVGARVYYSAREGVSQLAKIRSGKILTITGQDERTNSWKIEADDGWYTHAFQEELTLVESDSEPTP
jgi:hypothetical protein